KLQRAKPNSAPAIIARRELETARKTIDERRKQIAEGMAKTWTAKLRQEREMSNEQLEEKRLALAKWEQDLTAEVTTLTTECSKINESSLEIVSLREEIALLETTTKKVNDELEALKVEVKAPARVRVLEEGVISHQNAQRKRYMGTLLAGFAALALVLFGVTFLELRARRVF